MKNLTKRTIRVICYSLVLMFASKVDGRDNKDVRKKYTRALRTYLVQIDKVLSKSHRHELDRQAVKALVQNFEPIKVKLSPKKLAEAELILKRIEDPSLQGGAVEEIRKFRFHILEGFRVIDAPTQQPDLVLGAEKYRTYCSSCHGLTGRGDGKLAQNKKFPMIPAPTSLYALASEELRSPFSYYNLLLVGIEGTAMGAFDSELTDHERWSIAFYLSGRPFRDDKALWSPKEIFESFSQVEKDTAVSNFGTLQTLARLTDRDLKEAIKHINMAGPSPGADRFLIDLRRTMPYMPVTRRTR